MIHCFRSSLHSFVWIVAFHVIMSSIADESSSSIDESDGEVGVKSALYAIRASMKSKLAMMMVVVTFCDATLRPQIQEILSRYKKMCEGNRLVKLTQVAYLYDWRCLGMYELESFRKLEDAYKTLLNNMNKIQSMEKLYGMKKRKKRYAEYAGVLVDQKD